MHNQQVVRLKPNPAYDKVADVDEVAAILFAILKKTRINKR
jgi:hypothetical protein